MVEVKVLREENLPRRNSFMWLRFGTIRRGLSSSCIFSEHQDIYPTG